MKSVVAEVLIELLNRGGSKVEEDDLKNLIDLKRQELSTNPLESSKH
jgi:hypothetical protein